MTYFKYMIKSSFDLCTGCGLCQLACSFRRLGGYNPRAALLRIEHKKENLYHFPVVCAQCTNSYCANVCPTHAIQRDKSSLAMVVDHKACIGCGLCAQYCPVNMVTVDPELKKSVKCDLCNGDPRCVDACPTGALELVHIEDKNQELSNGVSNE